VGWKLGKPLRGIETGKASTWDRNIYPLKDTLRVKKLQSGDVGYTKVADIHNTKHTMTMLANKFLHL